jgi:Ca2+:H+ antiporter
VDNPSARLDFSDPDGYRTAPATFDRTGPFGAGYASPVARTLLFGSLVLAPVALAARFVFHASDTLLFVLAAAALIPLAWLIGEATEHAAEHTGPGIGGFLNASFGNAPELIIALFAVGNGLPDVVRGSLAGSVVSNILLVLGVALIAGGEGRLDRRSLTLQLGLVFLSVLVFLVAAIPGFSGDPNRHALAMLSIPVSVVLLLVYVAITGYNLRKHRIAHLDAADSGPGSGWTLRVALAALAGATLATALISEMLVHSLESFAHSAKLSEFFIAAVIVAIVGNAAEHGGAVVIARRGKIKLATEIAISSSAQVALFVAPAIALLSFLFPDPLALSFRPIELAAMGGAAAFVAIVIADGRSRRWEGFMLVGVYAAVVAGFWVAGDR